MAKFKIIRRYSLKDLGDEWNDCYLDFTPFTMREVNEDFGGLATVDQDDPKAVIKATSSVFGLLKKKFVSGKGIGQDGSTIDIGVDDLEELPAEVISGVLRFLSQGLAETNKPPSSK